MATFPGFLICCLVHQALKPAPVPPLTPNTRFGSFPTALCIRGIRGPPAWGPSLLLATFPGFLICCLVHQALKPAPVPPPLPPPPPSGPRTGAGRGGGGGGCSGGAGP